MSENQETQCVLQTDPYRLTWRKGDTETTKSYDPRVLGDGDILGYFWAVGKPIVDLSTAAEVYVDYGHPFVNSHPLVKRYWETAKKSRYSEDENLRTASEKARFHEAGSGENAAADKFSEHVAALDSIIGERLKDTPPEFFEIHIYCLDQELRSFLMDSLESDPQRKELLSKLRIRLVPVDSLAFLIEKSSPAALMIKTKAEKEGWEDNPLLAKHLCFWTKKGDGDIIDVAPNRNVPDPTFWLPKDNEELVELAWLYIDFYYLRWRYLDLWKHCLSRGLHFDSWADARNFISIGITSAAVAVDESECDASVVVKKPFRIRWRRVAPALESAGDGEIEPEISCARREGDANAAVSELSKNTAEDGGGTVEFPTAEQDRGKTLSVKFEIPVDSRPGAQQTIFALHRDGTLSETKDRTYEMQVSVEDDGYADSIAIHWEGRAERRNGVLVSPSGEDFTLRYDVTSPKNGRWQPDKDPVTFTINGEEKISPCLLPPDAGDVTAVAKTLNSGKEAKFELRRLPRADEIRFDIGHLTSGQTSCSIQREKNVTDLCKRGEAGEKGRRVESVRCAQGEEFVAEAYGVWSKDHSAEVWDKRCDAQIFDANNRPISENGVISGDRQFDHSETWLCAPDDDGWRLRLKYPGEFRLRVSSRDKSKDKPEVAYDVHFSVFADYSKAAMRAMIITALLAVVTTLCWYGLNICTSLIYLLCPATLYYVATHKEGCIREKRHKIVYYLAMACSVLIIFKAVAEELR